MNNIESNNISQLYDILSSVLSDYTERKAILQEAFSFSSQTKIIVDEIDYTGNTRSFVINLIEKLNNYGVAENELDALSTLLKVIRRYVGVDKQSYIDSYIESNKITKNTPNIYIISTNSTDKAYQDRLYFKLIEDQFKVYVNDIKSIPTVNVAIIISNSTDIIDENIKTELINIINRKITVISLIMPNGKILPSIKSKVIDFSDWKNGLNILLEYLQKGEEAFYKLLKTMYIENIINTYGHWQYLYTDMYGTSHNKSKSLFRNDYAQIHIMDMALDIFKTISHQLDEDNRSNIVQLQTFTDFLQQVGNFKRIALIGEPGAGKTTLLERLAYDLAHKARNSNEIIPLITRLNRYHGGDFDLFLESHFGGLDLSHYLPDKVFLLLDGLNEVSPENTNTIISWINKNRDISIIVTCRKLDYINFKLYLQRFDLTPLDVNRIYTFISNYLDDYHSENLFWYLSGKPTRESWNWLQKNKPNTNFADFWFGKDILPGEDWEQERRNLIHIRKELAEQGRVPGMLGVVCNPFLLFVVIQIYARIGQPPENRGQLFRLFVETLMEYRGKPAAKIKPPWINEEIQQTVLANLAYKMQIDKLGTSIDKQLALDAISKETSEDINQIIYLAASARIIEIDNYIRFFHQLLQEYFAAHRVRLDIVSGVSVSKYFYQDEWWLPTGWEETILLLSGMENDATQIVEWLSDIHPTLAYRCATESGSICSDITLNKLFDPPIQSLPDPISNINIDIDQWRAKLPRISPLARSEWGKRLSAIGDNRKGIYLHSNGLPDIDWVKIPEGNFIFGTDQNAYLPTFYIARYPVTHRQYEAFVQATDGIQDDRWWIGLSKEFKTPFEQEYKYWNYPRVNVNWYQAIAFCRWLSFKLTGTIVNIDNPLEWPVRLPTEFEWEKAARGIDGRLFPWGNQYIPGYANVDELDREDGPYWLREATAVGMYPHGTSVYGVYDMCGNVLEWTLSKYYEDNIDVKDDAIRIRKGGSWFTYVEISQVTNRDNVTPEYKEEDYGFRICCNDTKIIELEQYNKGSNT